MARGGIVTIARTPHITSTAHRAAKHLYKTGALSRADLFAQVYFGTKRGNREQMLDSAIANGWLIESKAGVAISEMLRAHFDSLEAPEPVYIGQIAGPRTANGYDRPPLKGITNSRGDHARAIDDRFQRGTDHHFFTVPARMP